MSPIATGGAAFVAVTASTIPEAGSYRKPQIALYAAYLAALERLRLTAVLLTTAHSGHSIGKLLDRCAGLVLTGGYDIDPTRYGQEPIEELGEVNADRDEMEFTALQGAIDRELPVLGICRGHQLLNVHFGGTLYQDIATQIGGAGGHRGSDDWTQHHHTVTVEPGSRLEQCLGVSAFDVNSFHHQAVDRVGTGLRASAHAEDGMIEAIESVHAPWILGVQWHPERHEAHAADTDPNRCVFNAFGAAVRLRIGG